MLPAIIAGLVPVVISFIESLVPHETNPTRKHEWVQGFFQDAGAALAKIIPPWLVPEMTAIETLVAEIVQAELDKLLPAN